MTVIIDGHTIFVAIAVSCDTKQNIQNIPAEKKIWFQEVSHFAPSVNQLRTRLVEKSFVMVIPEN